MMLDATFLPSGHTLKSLHQREVIQVAAVQSRSRVAGPGVRSVLWVTGCHRRCPGCMKPEWFDFDTGRSLAVEDVAVRLESVPDAVGVSFSGGEPFEQAPALASLATRLRANGRNVLVYTGYRLEFLQASGVAAVEELLAATDILIDGEYREDLRDAGGWRGSSNQRVIPLTAEGHAALECEESGARPPADVQVVFTDEAIRITGCPEVGFMRRFEAELVSRGLTLLRNREGQHDI